jgi:hypothetical protein
VLDADSRMFYHRSHVERSCYYRRGIRRGCRPPNARAQCHRGPEIVHVPDDWRLSLVRRSPCGPPFEATAGLAGSYHWAPSVYPHLPLVVCGSGGGSQSRFTRRCERPVRGCRDRGRGWSLADGRRRRRRQRPAVLRSGAARSRRDRLPRSTSRRCRRLRRRLCK